MGVFDIVMEKPAEVRWSDGCVSYSQGKTCWSQSKRWVCLMGVFDIVMEKPAEVSRGDGCVWQSLQNLIKSVSTMVVFDIVMEKPPEVSRGDGCVCHSYCKTYWSQSRRWVCLIKSWKNLLKSVQAMAVFDIVMEKPADVSRSDGCVWYIHGKTYWSQSKGWLCLI